MRRVLSTLIGLCAIVLLLLPTGASAQDVTGAPAGATPASDQQTPFGGFNVAPVPDEDPATTSKGYFIYEIAPGNEASGRVVLANPGAESVVVSLRSVDALTAQTGGNAFVTDLETPAAVGTWVHVDEPQVELEPGQEKTVGFTVRPPADTSPGQYLAGIEAAAIEAPTGTPEALEANQAGTQIDVRRRYVIAVQVNVPGEWTPSMTITGAEAMEVPSGTKLGIHLENDGDTFLRPSGTVVLRNAEATPILEEQIEMGTFVTGTDVTFPVAWPGTPVAGEYGVDVELNYADGGIARYSGTFGVSEDAPVAPTPEGAAPQQPAVVTVPAESPIQPWMIYALIGLLLAIVLLLVLLVVRSGRNRGRGA